MQNHRNTAIPPGRRKQIVLALGLALGLATGHAQADASRAPKGDLPGDDLVATLTHRASEAGITLPTDLPRIIARRAKAAEKAGDVVPKATHIVTNCNNSGAGSLRAAVGSAVSGDVIDLTGLACNIVLTSSIVTSVNNLTIRRDPVDQPLKYAIDANNADRVFTHTGTGTLTLSGLTIRNGRVTQASSNPAQGGCISSQGNVALNNLTNVKYCNAVQTGSGIAAGGAVFAAGTVDVTDGSMVANGIASSASGNAQGGGIHATRVNLSGALIQKNTARITGSGFAAVGGGIHTEALEAKYSIVRENAAVVSGSGSALSVRSGGAEISGQGDSSIKYSTFHDNNANAANAGGGGGSALTFGSSSSSTGSLLIKSSTFANNASVNSTKYGGALSLRKNAVIRSSTISGNTESNTENNKYGAGITLADGVELTMSSTIIAGNHLVPISGTGSGPISDIGLSDPDNDTATVVGTHNFTNWLLNGINWPSGNYFGLDDVKLGPLRDNGGLTPTMHPMSDSPVVNQGSTINIVFNVDQRGEGYPRVVGPQADIGAVEWSTRMFSDGFESN